MQNRDHVLKTCRVLEDMGDLENRLAHTEFLFC